MREYFEIGEVGNTRSIAGACQRALISAIKGVVDACRKETPDIPGLTWEQIHYLLDSFEKKEVSILEVNGEHE